MAIVFLYNINMAKKSQKTAEDIAKKAYKANPKAFIIAVVSIVLIIAITFAVIYFAFPDTYQAIISIFNRDADNGPNLNFGEDDLVVHMINVGQGDCIYIKLPDGKDMVIDSGSTKKPNNNSEFDETDVVKYLSSYITDKTIEYLMLTHTDEDHVVYLDDVVDAFQVNNIFMPYIKAEPNLDSLSSEVRSEFEAIPSDKIALFKDKDTISTLQYAEFFAAALNEPNCNIVLNVDEDENSNTIVLTDDDNTYEFKFYCPTKEYYDSTSLNTSELINAVSPVGILTYNNRKIVFTGDSNSKNEKIITKRTGKIDCDVLKVGHHGSDSSSTENFLDTYTFEYAMISSNLHKSYYHPRQDTLDRFKERNIAVYRTDNNGNIILVIDKDGNLRFETELDWNKETNYIGYVYGQAV